MSESSIESIIDFVETDDADVGLIAIWFSFSLEMLCFFMFHLFQLVLWISDYNPAGF